LMLPSSSAEAKGLRHNHELPLRRYVT
jgi:hypothetical protein